MIEIIFVRLATHLRFYVIIIYKSFMLVRLIVKLKYDSSNVKINQIVIILIY
jgi:hypothetical protein